MKLIFHLHHKTMNAIRQFFEVKNNSFNVILPEGFTAKTVEVIIIPLLQDNIVPDWHKSIVLERTQNPQTAVDTFEMIAQLEVDNIETL